MNARLMAVCTICGLVLAALIVSPGSSAPGAGAHGLFAGLKAGQLVELKTDQQGVMIRSFDDSEGRQGLNFKVTEIGADFVALEYESDDPNADRLEIRVPVYAFSAVQHVGKGGGKRPAVGVKKKN